MAVERLRPGLRPVTEQSRATPAELFFDLVFVFAFLQVTTLVVDEGDALGVLHGLLVLVMLWWSWSLFAWLGNRVRADYGLARFTLLAATPVMFVLAVATREAFEDFPGGAFTPVWFVGCFFLLRLMYLALRMYATPGLRFRDVVALTVPMCVAAGLLLAAALLPGSAAGARTVATGQVLLWVLAIGVDYAAGMALPFPDRAIHSARHWAERHNLIIIVALGEVLVAIGIAGTDLPGSAGLFIASALAVVIAGALEWIYFDLTTLAGEHALYSADLAGRVALARSGYTFLHLPMIIGVILLALGLKHMTTLVGERQDPRLDIPLHDLGRYAMYGGVALYLLAHAAFQLRLRQVTRALVWPRLGAVAVLLALLPLTAATHALGALGWLAGVCVATALTEFVLSRPQRRQLRRLLLDDEENMAARPDQEGLINGT
ncbi:low temperature requirement protein A [Micromonospora echinofusca]|uniref:Low temperature requirement protein A n=1 Tax=Micromonospora echinofusca TaxID=47858 RepID=A0ABS3VR52_MICEH|nr:low temperature requirement protein A [Micromonospora echinofusca]MBO4207008.1 low temperature requirement protein A [Micromonospora echinofusca]